MNRRDFMGSSLGAFLAGAAVGRTQGADTPEAAPLVSPRNTKLAVRPVMTNVVHSGAWEGPCRWHVISVADDAVGPAREQDRDGRHLDLSGILQVMQRHAQDIRVAVHRGPHAVDDAEPTVAGPQRRRPGADLVGEG